MRYISIWLLLFPGTMAVSAVLGQHELAMYVVIFAMFFTIPVLIFCALAHSIEIFFKSRKPILVPFAGLFVGSITPIFLHLLPFAGSGVPKDLWVASLALGTLWSISYLVTHWKRRHA